MSAAVDLFLAACLWMALALLALALVLVAIRIARGPTLPDRVLGLDTLTVVGVGFITVLGIATDVRLTVDIAIALGLVGFLATVAFARYIAQRGRTGEEPVE